MIFVEEARLHQEKSAQLRRAAGLCGLLGALLFFAGDMLFYGYFGAGSDFAAKMLEVPLRAPQIRLFVGGLIGPLAACLCILGFWHVRMNVRPSSRISGNVMFAAFFALMVSGSAVHTLWTAKRLAMKYCSGQIGPCSDLLAAVKSYWTQAYNIGAIPGYLGALILIVLVLFGRTRYSRWTVVANPALLILFSTLAAHMPAPFGSILVGGFTNLSIAVFFLVSVLSTWRDPSGIDTEDDVFRLRRLNRTPESIVGHRKEP